MRLNLDQKIEIAGLILTFFICIAAYLVIPEAKDAISSFKDTISSFVERVVRKEPIPEATMATSSQTGVAEKHTPERSQAPIPTRAPSPITVPVTPSASAINGGDIHSDMVLIEAGWFTRGSAGEDTNADNNEKPQKSIYLDSFWIDKYEVSNSLFRECVSAGKCEAPSQSKSHTHESYFWNPLYDKYPVIFLSWYAARDYCASVGKRLPTEAEWERAARWTDARIFPWGNDFRVDYLNGENSDSGDTLPVGSFPNGASRDGVLDMAGNVWEWVADWFDGDFYKAPESNNPYRSTPKEEYKVVRGGAWDSPVSRLRVTARYARFPGFGFDNNGFRCAR